MASVKSWWSWTSDTLEDAVAAVLKQGACPKHVAFIMDGNRRFARGKGLPVPEGHKLGYLKLQETLQWCLRLGVEVVTVYAFSIENFSRTQDEVDALMSLAEEKFDQIIREDEIVQKYGVSIRVLGDISRLPTSLQASIARAVQFSAHNDKSILNVCFSYISTEELERSKREIEAGITKGQLLSTDVTSELISQCMYTEDCPEPDIIIRTSGETRLSDFMLWQGGTSHLTFSKVLWPDLSLLDFAWLMMKYQLDYPLLEVSSAFFA
eukprot:TRINITY_DN7107_c0_g1_i1.p1 TRINITY_DN7107_c0_g1~~TRINITY_DN7107_c0_g1_i1.p1  ORF type:complete len:283 (-),score=67.20 TRINITY_DN7107_c0_g1_i1:8-805(-)